MVQDVLKRSPMVKALEEARFHQALIEHLGGPASKAPKQLNPDYFRQRPQHHTQDRGSN